MDKYVLSKKGLSINVKYFYGDNICSSRANVNAGNKLIIRTEMCFPVFSRFDLYVIHNNKLMQITVQVEKLLKENNKCDSMVVNVLHPQENFMNLVNNIIAERDA